MVGLFFEGIWAIGSLDFEPRERFYPERQTEMAGESEKEKPQEPGDAGSEGKRPVNALVLGLDEYNARTDTIILFNFSPEQGKLNIMSIARDTRVIHNGRGTKINSLYARGGEALVAAKVEEITGLPIRDYVTMDLKGFRKIVDLLGGVEVYVPFDMHYDDYSQNLHIHLRKGLQLLDGRKAEQFVRYRQGNRPGTGYRHADIDRMKVQQEFIKQIIKQKLNIRYLYKIDEIFRLIKEHVKTNIGISDVSCYIDQVRNVKYDEIKTFTLPGDSIYRQNIWYFIYDPQETKKIIDENFFK